MAKEIFTWYKTQLDELNDILDANNFILPRKYEREPLGFAKFDIDVDGTGIYDRFPQEIVNKVIKEDLKNRINVIFYAVSVPEAVASYNPGRNQLYFYIDPYSDFYFKKSGLSHIKDVVYHELVHFMQNIIQRSLHAMTGKEKGVGSPDTGISIDDFYDMKREHSLRPTEFYALLDTATRELYKNLKKPLNTADKEKLKSNYPFLNLDYAEFDDLESNAKFQVLFDRFKEFLYSNQVVNEMKQNPTYYKKFSSELYKAFLSFLEKKKIYSSAKISIMKSAIIKKEDGKYCVRSPKNPDWSGGCYKSKKKAKKRLQQIEKFKHMNKNKSDDGHLNMAKDLDNIAEYLEAAGFISDAKKVKDVAYLLDSASDEDNFFVEDNAIDIPDIQRNVGGPVGGYNGSSGGGAPSLFSVDVGTVASKGEKQMFKIAGKYDHIDFKPPKGVADAATRGLELRRKNDGKGGTDVGVQRAVNLKNRDRLSPSTVRRMKAFFDRHQKNKKIEKGKSPHEDKGYIAWCLWGGDPGYSWAKKVVRQMEAADKKKKAEFINGLKKVADSLDQKGFYNEAGHVDKIMRQMAEDDSGMIQYPEGFDPPKDDLPEWAMEDMMENMEEERKNKLWRKKMVPSANIGDLADKHKMKRLVRNQYSPDEDLLEKLNLPVFDKDDMDRNQPGLSEHMERFLDLDEQGESPKGLDRSRDLYQYFDEDFPVEMSTKDKGPKYDGIPKWQYSKLKKLVQEGKSYQEAKKEMPDLLIENYREMKNKELG